MSEESPEHVACLAPGPPDGAPLRPGFPSRGQNTFPPRPHVTTCLCGLWSSQSVCGVSGGSAWGSEHMSGPEIPHRLRQRPLAVTISSAQRQKSLRPDSTETTQNFHLLAHAAPSQLWGPHPARPGPPHARQLVQGRS